MVTALALGAALNRREKQLAPPPGLIGTMADRAAQQSA
jgi:hypothetical protein